MASIEIRPSGSPAPGPVVWSEDITVSPHRLTRLAGPLLSLVGKAGFGRVLRATAREAEKQTWPEATREVSAPGGAVPTTPSAGSPPLPARSR